MATENKKNTTTNGEAPDAKKKRTGESSASETGSKSPKSSDESVKAVKQSNAPIIAQGKAATGVTADKEATANKPLEPLSDDLFNRDTRAINIWLIALAFAVIMLGCTWIVSGFSFNGIVSAFSQNTMLTLFFFGFCVLAPINYWSFCIISEKKSGCGNENGTEQAYSDDEPTAAEQSFLSIVAEAFRKMNVCVPKNLILPPVIMLLAMSGVTTWFVYGLKEFIALDIVSVQFFIVLLVLFARKKIINLPNRIMDNIFDDIMSGILIGLCVAGSVVFKLYAGVNGVASGNYIWRFVAVMALIGLMGGIAFFLIRLFCKIKPTTAKKREKITTKEK